MKKKTLLTGILAAAMLFATGGLSTVYGSETKTLADYPQYNEIVQKYYEITSEDSKNQVRENTGEWSGYYGLYGKEYVTAAWRTFFDGLSGSDDISESDDHGWKTDRGGGEDP